MKIHIELEIAPEEVPLATELLATLRWVGTRPWFRAACTRRGVPCRVHRTRREPRGSGGLTGAVWDGWSSKTRGCHHAGPLGLGTVDGPSRFLGRWTMATRSPPARTGRRHGTLAGPRPQLATLLRCPAKHHWGPSMGMRHGAPRSAATATLVLCGNPTRAVL